MSGQHRSRPAGAVADAVPYPAGLWAARLLVERNARAYQGSWLRLVSGFFEPVFYLFSLGVGLGVLVGDLSVGGRTVSYQEFVAPGLMAASAMNGAVMETTFSVFWKIRYSRLYEAVLATPLSPGAVAVGEVAWSLIRGTAYAAAFLGVLAVAGYVASWWALLAVPASLLIGLAFGGAGMAASTFMRSWQDFDLVQLVILPMFLFSATFYPLATYPPALQAVVRLTPLYHGVALQRDLLIGTPGLHDLGHVAYLVVLGAVGMVIAGRRLGKLLLS